MRLLQETIVIKSGEDVFKMVSVEAHAFEPAIACIEAGVSDFGVPGHSIRGERGPV